MNLVSIKDYVAAEKQRIKEKLADCDKQYRLDIFQIGDIDASNRYIKWKIKDCEEVGIKAVLHKFETKDDVDGFNSVGKLVGELYEVFRERTDGVILQLPAPRIAKSIVKSSIEAHHGFFEDVDGMFFNHHDPCTPRGIIDWLEYNKVNLDGANVTIIGWSDIVGKPLARMMLERNATVTVCHSHTRRFDLVKACSFSDIIISAVGKPKFIKKSEFSADSQIIIDAGINKDSSGKLCGDVDNDVSGIANDLYVTPVPGGVGLLTRLALLKNVIGEW